MGHLYERTASGRMALCCDRCGNSGGVRARRCPYKVDGLSYCYPPDLCTPCYKAEGGLRGVHGDRCREGAAEAQAEHDAIRVRLDAGELQVRAAWGSWHENVPDGKVGVVASDGSWFMLDASDYRTGNGGFITDYPSATPCDPIDGHETKQVTLT